MSRPGARLRRALSGAGRRIRRVAEEDQDAGLVREQSLQEAQCVRRQRVHRSVLQPIRRMRRSCVQNLITIAQTHEGQQVKSRSCLSRQQSGASVAQWRWRHYETRGSMLRHAHAQCQSIKPLDVATTAVKDSNGEHRNDQEHRVRTVTTCLLESRAMEASNSLNVARASCRSR
jgi:hypothetical protein